MDGLIEEGPEQREEGQRGRTGVEDLSLFLRRFAGKRRVQVAVVASAVEEIVACSSGSSSSSFGSSRSSSRRFPSLPSQRPQIHS